MEVAVSKGTKLPACVGSRRIVRKAVDAIHHHAYADCIFVRGNDPLRNAVIARTSNVLAEATCLYPLELSALESGQIIVKLPKTAETREVAAFAIGRLDVPAEFFLRRMRDIVNFKKSDKVLQIGKFSDPPRLEDLTNLTLDSTEMESMRRCKVSQCDFKMSASAIERFRKQVNWSA